MREIAVFTDGDVDVPDQYRNRVEMLPQYYYFEPEMLYGDQQILEREAFFERLKTTRAYTAGSNPDLVRTKICKSFGRGKRYCVRCLFVGNEWYI